MSFAAPSVTDVLSLDAVVARLSASPRVDGIAEFGSRAAQQTDAASDYDLLVVVDRLPHRVFQMVTSINGRVADIVLVERVTVDEVLASTAPPPSRSFAGLFARKMQTARIVYDPSARLRRAQALAREPGWASPAASEAERYAAWFWQGHGLLHLERMARSAQATHLAAVDMLLTSCLPATWRGYFDVRGLPWEGEKAALRYWAAHDPAYGEMVAECLAPGDRQVRLAAYRRLVERTLEPLAPPFGAGETAVMLADADAGAAEAQAAVRDWEALLGE